MIRYDFYLIPITYYCLLPIAFYSFIQLQECLTLS